MQLSIGYSNNLSDGVSSTQYRASGKYTCECGTLTDIELKFSIIKPGTYFLRSLEFCQGYLASETSMFIPNEPFLLLMQAIAVHVAIPLAVSNLATNKIFLCAKHIFFAEVVNKSSSNYHRRLRNFIYEGSMYQA